MTDRDEWQGRVGEMWAREWSRTDRSFAGLTDRLLGLASAGGFERALDVGCGAGELSLALARGHPGASVRGLDVSESLIDAARTRGRQLPNATFEIADASRWSPEAENERVDLAVSRHGVMFFDDPIGAFVNLLDASKPGGRLVFSCFRDRDDNRWASEIGRLLPGDTPPRPNAPGPFSFAEKDRVRTILGAAGWREMHIEAFDYPYIAGAGDDCVGDATSFFLSIGPAAAAAAALSPEERQAFEERLRDRLEAFRDGSIVVMRAAAWLVTARKGD